MHRKGLLRISVVLMFFVLSIAFVNGQDDTTLGTVEPATTPCDGTDCTKETTINEGTTVETTYKPTTVAATTKEPTTIAATTNEPTTIAATTKKPIVTTQQAQKPQKYYTTKKPSPSDPDDEDEDNVENTGSSFDSMNIWVAYADAWDFDDESRFSGRGRGRGRGRGSHRHNNKVKDEKPSNDDDDGQKETKGKKKKLFKRVPVPVRHYSNIRQFPIKRFPPLISILPWLPIFYDKVTYQTIIFSPKGGMYILPPLINFYGQRFSVAQLIKWGYASLVSTGAPPPPSVDVAPLVQTPSAGNTDSTNIGSSLAFDEKRAQFTNGVQTNFLYFKPQYSPVLYEAQYAPRQSPYENRYGSNSYYGGTGK